MDEGRIRKIIHIDMDAFYASVEQRDDPTLKGKPVAVGYPAKRGVVAAASYEARGFGVRSAMPSTIATRKCAELVFVPPRFDVYREVSKQVQAIFKDYTPLCIVVKDGRRPQRALGCADTRPIRRGRR
jgi:DNA polymerase-4